MPDLTPAPATATHPFAAMPVVHYFQMTKRKSKGAYMISAVAEMYDIHPQTLRLYEREGLLKPSRTEGNTRLYTDEDLQRLEFILTLARDLSVSGRFRNLCSTSSAKFSLARLQPPIHPRARLCRCAGRWCPTIPAANSQHVKDTIALRIPRLGWH